MSRPVVEKHQEHSVHTKKSPGRKSRHWPLRAPDVKTPAANVLPGAPGSGAAPGSNGPPTTGAMGPGGPLGST